MNIARYRKLLVAIVGAVALFVPEAAGLEGDFATVYDGVVGILVAFGVFRVPNAPAEPTGRSSWGRKQNGLA